MFSCTFAPAAESYAMHLILEEQNDNNDGSHRLPFILHKDHYNFIPLVSQGVSCLSLKLNVFIFR